jgi:hypothetical protein
MKPKAPHDVLAEAIGLWMQNEITKGSKPGELATELMKGLGLGVRWYAAASARPGCEDFVVVEIVKGILNAALFSRAEVHTVQ